MTQGVPAKEMKILLLLGPSPPGLLSRRLPGASMGAGEGVFR